MGALAHLESRLIPVEPGGQAVLQVRVRNTGTVVDQFTFQILGDAEAWTVVEPATLSLFPAAEEMVTITVAPPRSANVPAGQMPIGVRVLSREDPQGSVVEEAVLDVAPFSDVFAELAPRTSRGSRGATHDLAIDNRGNAPLNAALSAIDPDRLLRFDVNPPGVLADPGAATFAKVGVKPRRRFWRGSSQTRPFQVLLDTGGPNPISVDGTLVQEPILPPWFMRALLLLLGLLVLAIVLWIMLIRPAIQSAAEERTEDLLAQVGITPPPGGFGPGGGGGGGGEPTPSPATTPGGNGASPSPTAPSVAGLGQIIDGRIEAGGPPLVVEAGKTVFVTDLVFSNPSDTSVGEIRLERNGAPLLILQLQNFRDLDFHFVTPVAVLADQQLGLNCPGGCPGAAVYYSGYQR
jgi:hypothetical protein